MTDLVVCDVLLVLGGEDRDHWPRCGAALGVYRAMKLAGLTPPKLLVSGGKWVACRSGTCTEAALMAAYLRQQGVPDGDVLTEPHAMNTLGNVVLGGELARKLGLKRVGLATDDYHLWRSAGLYQRVFGAPPAVLVGTGDAGSWRQRTREWVSFVRLELALRLRGVPKHDEPGHRGLVEPSLL